MSFATWSIRRPIPVVVGFTIAALAGLIAFARLPVQDMPDVTLPAVTVTAQLESRRSHHVDATELVAGAGGV
jgi:multidrug efflux pump subunit AcrB